VSRKSAHDGSGDLGDGVERQPRIGIAQNLGIQTDAPEQGAAIHPGALRIAQEELRDPDEVGRLRVL
jgi:hypothetical protein